MEKIKAKSCAMRGRNPNNPSDRTPGIHLEQRIEIGGQISNCITTVTKDYLVITRTKGEEMKEDKSEAVEDYLYTAKDGERYGIFKLSPRECLRLMDVADEDIDKMFAVNSNSQCYKQAGNSIVVVCLTAIFSQLHIQGIKSWNERTIEEKKALLGWKGVLNAKVHTEHNIQ